MTERRVDEIDVRPSRAEAVVLFDWIHRAENAGSFDDLADLPGDRESLWALSAALERVLVEPFQADYAAVVTEARRSLLPDDSGPM